MCLDRESLKILLRYRCVTWWSLFLCCLNPYFLIHVTGSWSKSSIESTNFMPFQWTSKSDKLHAWQVMAQSLLPLRWFFLCPVVHNFTNLGGWKLLVASPILVRSAEVSWGDTTAAPQPRGTWLSLGAFSAVLLTGSRFRRVKASEPWKRLVPSTPKGLNMYQVRGDDSPSVEAIIYLCWWTPKYNPLVVWGL